jgi:hypothetical protein
MRSHFVLIGLDTWTFFLFFDFFSSQILEIEAPFAVLAWIFSSQAGDFLVFLAGSVEYWSYIVAWIYLGQDYHGTIFSVHVCESLYLV